MTLLSRRLAETGAGPGTKERAAERPSHPDGGLGPRPPWVPGSGVGGVFQDVTRKKQRHSPTLGHHGSELSWGLPGSSQGFSGSVDKATSPGLPLLPSSWAPRPWPPTDLRASHGEAQESQESPGGWPRCPQPN